MADELIKTDGALPVSPQMTVTASGEGTAIGVNYGGIHIHMDPTPEVLKALFDNYGLNLSSAPALTAPAPVSHAAEWEALSSDAYSLFVLENEEYDCGAFAVSKANALEQYTAEEYQAEFRSLSPAARDVLMNMPCIFARRNSSYRHTKKDHPVVVGRITDIKVGTDTVRFRFDHFCVFSQEDINDNIDLFGLASCPLRNELDEEHWSIRRGNLQDILKRIGVEIK